MKWAWLTRRGWCFTSKRKRASIGGGYACLVQLNRAHSIGAHRMKANACHLCAGPALPALTPIEFLDLAARRSFMPTAHSHPCAELVVVIWNSSHAPSLPTKEFICFDYPLTGGDRAFWTGDSSSAA